MHELFSTLGLLFSRPHFQALTIEHDDSIESSKYSSLILKGFLMSPCPHEQQLNYDITLYSAETPEVDASKVTSIGLGAETILQCALDHKIFLTDTDEIFKQLLCFPHIRLKQLIFQLDVDVDNGQLHHAAIHPDLQVTNLRLELGDSLPDTACDDTRALLKMPTLMKLIVTGEYSSMSIPPLVQGLADQAKVGSLRFLIFDDGGLAVSCNRSEFVELFDVIFSLSQINDLELTVSGSYLLETVEDYQVQIYESWKCMASGRQLKCIKFMGFDDKSNERDLTILNKIALSSELSVY